MIYLCEFYDLQSKDKHGITAILAAIWEGHKECVKLLIEKVFNEILLNHDDFYKNFNV